MPSEDEIRTAVATLGVGSTVILVLADGRRVKGELAAVEAEGVRLADGERVELRALRDVLVERVSEGLE